MNVLILSDVEGISGVISAEMIEHYSAEYAITRQLLADDINVAVDACFDAGVQQVYVVDGHEGGGTLLPGTLDSRAKQVSIHEWQELLVNGKLDMQIEIGCHAMPGTLNGFLDHTINSKSWFEYSINEVPYSELAMHALICGIYQVPLVACSGDEAACKQAKEFIPEIECAVVKYGIGRNAAEPVEAEEAHRRIRKAVIDGITKKEKIIPYFVQCPLTVELTFYRTDMCDETYASCDSNVVRVNARTLRKKVDQVTKYQDIKF